MSKISRDTPLAEITLRRYEKPTMTNRDLVRKFCLSVGLLQPGDSRYVVVDVLYVILNARKENKRMTSKDVETAIAELRKQINLPLVGITSPNVIRQLRRLKEISIIEKHADSYRIAEGLRLNELFEERIEKYLIPSITSRIKEYTRKIDEEF